MNRLRTLKPKEEAPKMRHKAENCSVCGAANAAHSSDFGRTWQCSQHKKK